MNLNKYCKMINYINMVLPRLLTKEQCELTRKYFKDELTKEELEILMKIK